jgi:hypothetical protein
MALEVRTHRGKAVPVGLGLLMKKSAERPGYGKGKVRQVLEKPHQHVENESGK